MELNELLIRDKFTGLEQVAEILREEVAPLASSFFVLNGEPVVRFKRDEGGYVFSIEIKASRVKPFGGRMA